jgi:hypothetical protein
VTTLELVAVGLVAAWLLVLTVVAMLAIRQIGLLTIRLDRDRLDAAPVADGLAVGQPVPPEVSELLVVEPNQPAFVLIFAAVCGPCRQLVAHLADMNIDARLVAIISGRRELARALHDMLPSSIEGIEDPSAEHAVRALQISTTPFVFEIRDGVIAAKAALRDAEHLQRFVAEAQTMTNTEFRSELEVQTHAGS